MLCGGLSLWSRQTCVSAAGFARGAGARVPGPSSADEAAGGQRRGHALLMCWGEFTAWRFLSSAGPGTGGRGGEGLRCQENTLGSSGHFCVAAAVPGPRGGGGRGWPVRGVTAPRAPEQGPLPRRNDIFVVLQQLKMKRSRQRAGAVSARGPPAPAAAAGAGLTGQGLLVPPPRPVAWALRRDGGGLGEQRPPRRMRGARGPPVSGPVAPRPGSLGQF